MSVCVCLSVPKDLINRQTDKVLTYNAASNSSGENNFIGSVQPPSQEKWPMEKNTLPPPNLKKNIYFLKLK